MASPQNAGSLPCCRHSLDFLKTKITFRQLSVLFLEIKHTSEIFSVASSSPSPLLSPEALEGFPAVGQSAGLHRQSAA